MDIPSTWKDHPIIPQTGRLDISEVYGGKFTNILGAKSWITRGIQLLCQLPTCICFSGCLSWVWTDCSMVNHHENPTIWETISFWTSKHLSKQIQSNYEWISLKQLQGVADCQCLTVEVRKFLWVMDFTGTLFSEIPKSLISRILQQTFLVFLWRDIVFLDMF